MRVFIAIDPGERWTGLAVLTSFEDAAVLLLGVIDNGDDPFRQVGIIDEILGKVKGVPVLCLEDYRVRPVGHQRFTRGQTLRALGALEYIARRASVPTVLVQPGNIKKDLNAFKINKLLKVWDPALPGSGDHAKSALRILAHSILQMSPSLLPFLAFEDCRYRSIPSAVARSIETPWKPHLTDADTWANPCTLHRIRE
jgi:hypothetical protein